MKTIKVPGTIYGPGWRLEAGEYVRADVARGLLQACKKVHAAHQKASSAHCFGDMVDALISEIADAIAAAQEGEEMR